MSSAAHAYFRRRGGSSGEPRAFPACEFDPGCRNDSCSSRPGRCGRFRQPLAFGCYSRGCPSAGVRRDRHSGRRLSFGRAILASRRRLGRSAEVSRLWRLDVRLERALSRPRLRRSIYHWVGDGGRVGRSLRGADEPCPKEQCHPGGIRAHPLSPHVEPVQRCSLCTGNARALSTMAYGFAAICAPAIILAPTFFRYWIGADFAMISAPVAQMLFPGMWMGSLALVGFTLLQSQGRADVTGRLSIIEFLPFIAILWSLTWAFGIVGGAAAWSFRCAVDALATLWLAGMKRRDVLPLLPPAALLAASLRRGSLPWLQRSRKFPRRGVRRIRLGGPRLSLLGRLAHAHSGAVEPNARFLRHADQPGQAVSARQHKPAKIGKPEFWGEVQPPASLKGLDIPSRRAVFVPWKPSRRRAFGMGNPTFR